jgi:membrane protease YdiL (CAAX protease family)
MKFYSAIRHSTTTRNSGYITLGKVACTKLRVVSKFLSRHRVISFLVLTYLISWVCWSLGYLLFRDNFLLQIPFLRFGAFSPALVSILLCSLENSEKSESSGKKSIAFLVTWAIAVFHFIIYLVYIEGIRPTFISMIISVFTAILPAYTLSGIFSGNKNLREHLSTILYPVGNLVWYIIALILIPVLLSLDAFINHILGNQPGEADYTLNDHTIPGFIGIFLLILIAQSLQAGGLSEEPGWRGYALRNLQTRFSPLVAGTMVGFGWGFWHLPVYIPQFSTTSIWMILYTCFQLGIVFTWIYNRTKGSLLSVIILHAAWNTFTQFIPKTVVFDILVSVFLLFVILWDKMWKPYRAI